MVAARSATAWILVAPVLALAWGFAPPHLHHGDHDHAGRDVVHQHVAPHQFSAHIRQSGARIATADDDDEAVVWLNGAVLGSGAFELTAPIAVAVNVFHLPAAKPTWFPHPQDGPAPAHGPPRAPSTYRGPPASCLS